LGDYAWFKENSNGQTHPVGEKKANAWGLYDMHGNVFEWCSNPYYKYPKSAISDSTDPIEPSFRMDRGGSWGYGAAYCRSASRYLVIPESRDSSLGFRVALSPSGVTKK
jgi:formylglycine-generating enzyme required for sulfatase activity